MAPLHNYRKRIPVVLLIALVAIRLAGFWNAATQREEPVAYVPPPLVDESPPPEWHPCDPTLPFDFGPRKHHVPMVFSPDGRFIACGYGEWDNHDVVEIWDLKTGEKELLEPRVPDEYDHVSQVEYNGNGDLLAVCYSGQAISIFNIKTNKILSTFVCKPPGNIGRYLRFTEENKLRFFEETPDERLQITEMDPASGMRKVVYFLPAEASLTGVIASGGGYATAEADTKTEFFTETIVVDINHKTKLFSFVRWAITGYIPGRQRMIVQHKRELQLLSLPSGRVLKRLDLGENADGPARHLAVSPSGALAALSGLDGPNDVRIIDVEKMREIRKINIGPSESMPAVVTFSRDEKYLLTSTQSLSTRDRWCEPLICIWKLE